MSGHGADGDRGEGASEEDIDADADVGTDAGATTHSDPGRDHDPGSDLDLETGATADATVDEVGVGSDTHGEERMARPTGADPDEEWLAAVDDVLETVVEREDVLECRLEDVDVAVPLRFGDDAPQAHWRLDGTVRIDVEGASGALADWLRLWRRRQ